jgi:hypothetical protein
MLLVRLNSLRKDEILIPTSCSFFFSFLFSLVLLCRIQTEELKHLFRRVFIISLLGEEDGLGVAGRRRRRWGLEIKSELSEWGPVALVSLQHTQTWEIEPADYQTKEDEKNPLKRREASEVEEEEFNAPRARFRAVVVSCHLT